MPAPETPQPPPETPTPPVTGQVTQILSAAAAGDPRAGEALLPLVYEELRRLAHGAMQRERSGQTLQPTALVHEAYLRLVGGDEAVSWNSRGHFFGAAALAMRRILVERARHRQRLKHGGAMKRVDASPADLAEALKTEDQTGTDLVALDGALDRLAAYDRRKSEVVMLKYFAGLTNDQVAAALDVSSATVRNDWTFAKAWLKRELAATAPGADAAGAGGDGAEP